MSEKQEPCPVCGCIGGHKSTGRRIKDVIRMTAEDWRDLHQLLLKALHEFVAEKMDEGRA